MIDKQLLGGKMKKYKVSELIEILNQYKIDLTCLMSQLMNVEDEYITDDTFNLLIQSCLYDKELH